MGRAFENALALHWALPQVFVMGPWLPFYPLAVSIIGAAGLVIGAVQAIWRRSAAVLWFLLPVAVIHAFLQNALVWRLGIERFPWVVLGGSIVALLVAMGLAVYRTRTLFVAAFALSVFCLMYAANAYIVLSFVLSVAR